MHPNEGQKQAGVRLMQHLDSFLLPLSRSLVCLPEERIDRSGEESGSPILSLMEERGDAEYYGGGLH